jgi:hypothetical protein
MKDETPIPRRLRSIFRVLSGLTLADGSVGFILAAHNIINVPVDSTALEYLIGHPYSHSSSLLYSIDSANLVLNVMLLAAGALLWKLQRRGLLLLICVLLAEVVFVLSILAVGASKGFAPPVGFIVGMGLFPFVAQAVTVFPIVAGILIPFAYRCQGMPTRAEQ